jgi:hypothetical protein
MNPYADAPYNTRIAMATAAERRAGPISCAELFARRWK